MDAQRKRFAAAVILFVVWLGILGTLAARSSKPPPRRPALLAEP